MTAILALLDERDAALADLEKERTKRIYVEGQLAHARSHIARIEQTHDQWEQMALAKLPALNAALDERDALREALLAAVPFVEFAVEHDAAGAERALVQMRRHANV